MRSGARWQAWQGHGLPSLRRRLWRAAFCSPAGTGRLGPDLLQKARARALYSAKRYAKRLRHLAQLRGLHDCGRKLGLARRGRGTARPYRGRKARGLALAIGGLALGFMGSAGGFLGSELQFLGYGAQGWRGQRGGEANKGHAS